MHAVETLLLVTGKTEKPHLSAIVADRFPAVRIVNAPDSNSLEATVANLGNGARTSRLVTIATDILVPGDVIDRLPTRGYNFHAGSPTYPGSHPASFAIYEGAKRFGVTLHELAPKIDSGQIVAVDRFDIRPGATAAELNSEAYIALIDMFSRWIDRLLVTTDDLPLSDERWSGPSRTRAEAFALSDPDRASNAGDRDLRNRAFSVIRRG